jgi:anti-sigma-K factor RskA
MSEIDHEQWQNELAPYLLGALGPDEVDELDRHLAACAECRGELERLRPVAQVLPESVERVVPPPQLRARVMAEVHAGIGEERARTRPAFGHRGRAVFLRPAAAVVAVVLLAAAALTFAIGDGGPDDEVTTVAAGKAPGVTAELVSEDDSGTLHLANLRSLPPNEALQAWVQRGKRVEPAGTPFVSRPNGTAVAEIDDMQGVSTVMVTVEPRGGSAFPTSDPLISVQAPQ